MEQMKEKCPSLKLRQGEPMAMHTTFQIGGPAELYAAPSDKELPVLLSLAKTAQVPVTVIGKGSNLLVSDQGIKGLVIEIGKGMEEVVVCGTKVTAKAGATLGKVAQVAAEHGLGGFEFAAGIPGSVGGAVVMNAGAYGGEMKDVLLGVKVLDKDANLLELSVEELDLSYRHSCIETNGYLVVEATYELEPKPVEKIRNEMKELAKKRLEKQPLEYPSAGSTFKRPEGMFAGKLIMDAGLRGYRVGDAQVSEKHCGFVVNKGKATADEVCRLIEDVQKKVWEEYQVLLEPEVKMIGVFDKA